MATQSNHTSIPQIHAGTSESQRLVIARTLK
jgi:hypothetical protein